MQFLYQGVFSKGPFDPRADPIGSLLTYAGCSPGKILDYNYLSRFNMSNMFSFKLGFCFCNGTEKEVDARPQVFKIVHDLCPRGEINRLVK